MLSVASFNLSVLPNNPTDYDRKVILTCQKELNRLLTSYFIRSVNTDDVLDFRATGASDDGSYDEWVDSKPTLSTAGYFLALPIAIADTALDICRFAIKTLEKLGLAIFSAALGCAEFLNKDSDEDLGHKKDFSLASYYLQESLIALANIVPAALAGVSRIFKPLSLSIHEVAEQRLAELEGFSKNSRRSYIDLSSPKTHEQYTHRHPDANSTCTETIKPTDRQARFCVFNGSNEHKERAGVVNQEEYSGRRSSFGSESENEGHDEIFSPYTPREGSPTAFLNAAGSGVINI